MRVAGAPSAVPVVAGAGDWLAGAKDGGGWS